jgi:tetratricopeptide (TPR) repeat protein
VRLLAAEAAWRIWGRSGDFEIDELFLRGSGELQDGNFRDALATFDQIVQRKPDFAEGWNKRATIRFLLGDYENSLMDCDEVFKRNPKHFGALAGAGQIHVLLGHPEQALDFFRRALAVNPNLEGPAQMKELIERHLRDEERDRRRHST